MIFTINETPISMPRPQVSRHGVYYTRGKVIKEHKQKVKDEFFRVAKQNGYKDDIVFKEGTPVKVYIRFYFKVPKNTPKYLREDMLAGRVMHLKKPDIDNLLKMYMDALNPSKADGRGAWADDKQVVTACLKKLYADKPKVEIMITEAETWTAEGM